MLDEFLDGSEACEGGKGQFLRGVEEGRSDLWGCWWRGLILFREVNELNRTPEASTL